jgi:hypothetical protein
MVSRPNAAREVNSMRRQEIRSPVRWIAAWLLWGMVAGCGGGPEDAFERQKVEGTVTLNGQPLPYGEIFFKGTADEAGQAPQAFLPIRNGKFASAHGVRPGIGANDVMITVFSADPDQVDANGKDAPVEGTWSGQVQIADKEPLAFDLKKNELTGVDGGPLKKKKKGQPDGAT